MRPGPEGKVDALVHKACLELDITHIESLCNLEALIDQGEFRFIGLPLKWRGGTGSPIRAVAVFDLWSAACPSPTAASMLQRRGAKPSILSSIPLWRSDYQYRKSSRRRLPASSPYEKNSRRTGRRSPQSGGEQGA